MHAFDKNITKRNDAYKYKFQLNYLIKKNLTLELNRKKKKLFSFV